MGGDATPGWGLILLVLAVLALIGLMVTVGVRDWFREAAEDRRKRNRVE